MNIVFNNGTKLTGKSCVALGNFDGVHLGHQKIIKSCIQYAKKNNLRSLIYIFSTHPSVFLGNETKILTDNKEKTNILQNLGCDCVYFENFADVANLSPEDFCGEIIAEKLNASAVFCGENYTFGKKAMGNSKDLERILGSLGIKTFSLSHVTKNDTVVSSTYIRNLIENGLCDEATEFSGRPFSISGKVLHGKKLGRTLGFPTVNMAVPSSKVVPSHGVYFTLTAIDNDIFYSVSNVGTRPTVDSNKKSSYINCETHIINHSGNDYEKNATIYFISKIRDEKKFSDTAQLKEAISNDIETANKLSQKFDKTTIELY